jgi:hypothetical protein
LSYARIIGVPERRSYDRPAREGSNSDHSGRSSGCGEPFDDAFPR